MITLHLAIYEGDVEQIPFASIDSLLEYMEELRMFDCVWVVTDGDEVLVTDNLLKILRSISYDYMFDLKGENAKLFVQEYPSFEAAYEVALMLREDNPKCYNNED